MIGDLINPADSLERQNEKLLKIVQTLMRRVEQNTREPGLAYAQFQRAALRGVRQYLRALHRAFEVAIVDLYAPTLSIKGARHRTRR